MNAAGLIDVFVYYLQSPLVIECHFSKMCVKSDQCVSSCRLRLIVRAEPYSKRSSLKTDKKLKIVQVILVGFF